MENTLAVNRQGASEQPFISTWCLDEDAFLNIYRLLVVACTLPITSAEAERSFSLMK